MIEQTDSNISLLQKATEHNEHEHVLAVMLFRIGVHNFALDAEQIHEMSFVPESLDIDRRNPDQVLIYYDLTVFSMFHLLREKVDSIIKPRLVKFMSAGNEYGLIIEEPHSFSRVNLDDLYAMPTLINNFRGNMVLWGFFFQSETINFLVDLHRLPSMGSLKRK
ncbi:hypothetical protein JXQ70_10530 [bacterium]|nr:hypothetical protein [bacterium]